MKRKNVNAKEMELRNNKDVRNAKKMISEGGPVVVDDLIAADSERDKTKVSKNIEKK